VTRSKPRRLSVPLVPAIVRWFGVITVVAVIVYYSLVTVPPEPPGVEPGSLWDKRLHFVAYATFTGALAYATVDHRKKALHRAVAVLGVALLFGALIELAQGMLSYRSFGWGDLLANALGAGLGSLWFLVERRIQYVGIAGPTVGD
jgi:VanZ family protein